MRKNNELLSRIYVFLIRRQRIVIECHNSFARTFGIVTSVNISICSTVPCHTFTIKLHVRQTNLKLLEKKRRTQSRIKKSQSFDKKFFFDPKASFSRLQKLIPLRRGHNCDNSYCENYEQIRLGFLLVSITCSSVFISSTFVVLNPWFTCK